MKWNTKDYTVRELEKEIFHRQYDIRLAAKEIAGWKAEVAEIRKEITRRRGKPVKFVIPKGKLSSQQRYALFNKMVKLFEYTGWANIYRDRLKSGGLSVKLNTCVKPEHRKIARQLADKVSKGVSHTPYGDISYERYIFRDIPRRAK